MVSRLFFVIVTSYRFHTDKTIAHILISPTDTECIVELASEWSHDMYDAAENQQLYYASICFGTRRLGLILKTLDEQAARENAQQICDKLTGLGTEVALLSVSRVKLE